MDNPARRIPYQFGMGYVILAMMMFALSFTKESREPARTNAGH